MNSFTFASVTNPDKYGFRIDKETSWERSFGVCRWAKFFETLGDGRVQHSKEVPFSIDMLEDFLGSMAAALAAEPADMRQDVLELLDGLWPRRQNSREKIEFALSLKCKPEKTFYYCLEDCKTSTSDSKRHDRRWEKVSPFDSHVNGEVTSAAQILNTGACYDTIHSLAAFLEILAVAERSTLNVFQHFGMGKDAAGNQSFRSLNQAEAAWRAVADYVAAFRSMKDAARAVECWAHNVNNAKQAPTTAVA